MMLSSDLDILSEIDTTIDQLLENADALNKISHKSGFEEEKLALEKTQESLLAHLIHMDKLLKTKQPKYTRPDVQPLLISNVHDKLGRSGYLNHMQRKTSSYPSEEAPLESKMKKAKIHKKKVAAMKLVRS